MAQQIGFNNKNDLDNLPDGGTAAPGDKVVVATGDCDGFVLKTLPTDADTTNVGFSFSGTTITLTDSTGNAVSQDLSGGNLSVNPDDVITSLSVVNDTITIGTLAGGSFSGSITDDDTTAAGLSVIGGNIVLTDSAGGSVSVPVSQIDTDTTYTFTVNPDGTTTAEAFDADGNSLGVQDFGHELQAYKQGAPNTLAEVVVGAGKGVDFGSTGWLTTNRSVEAGASGVRNVDGSLGHYSPILGSIGPALQYNGSTALITTGVANVLPDGIYTGQLLSLSTVGIDVPAVLEGKLAGPHMRLADDRTYGNPNSLALSGVVQLSVRLFENLILMWDGATWLIKSWDKLYYSGLGWHERTDGLINQEGRISLAAGAQANLVYNVPIIVGANTSYRVSAVGPDFADGKVMLFSFDASSFNLKNNDVFTLDLHWEITGGIRA